MSCIDLLSLALTARGHYTMMRAADALYDGFTARREEASLGRMLLRMGLSQRDRPEWLTHGGAGWGAMLGANYELRPTGFNAKNRGV